MNTSTAKRAFALATVILVLSLLVGMAGVVFRDVSVGLQHGAERTLRTQARYAAYAGLQRSLSALYQDPSWSAGYDREDLPGTPEVEYSVTVLNNVGNLNSIFAPDGTEIPPNGVFLRAKGHVRGEDIISNAGLASLAVRKKPIFNFAAVGSTCWMPTTEP